MFVFSPGKVTIPLHFAARVRERSFLQEMPEGHMIILTFEGINPEAGYLEVINNSPPKFAEAAMEIHGLDVNAPPSTFT